MSVCLCELILTKTWKQTNECLFMWINVENRRMSVCLCEILTKTWKQTNECLFMWVNINKNLKTDEWVFVYVN